MTVLSTFNPSTMSSALIEGTFVQREPLAERLVALFEESALRDSKHNVLLVGPRGIGKSHLVSLVYHRLKAKSELNEKLCIAYLREDEWGIGSFLDFLLRVLRAALGQAVMGSPSGLPDLSGLSRSAAEARVWQGLRDVLGARTLLVIVENLDAVFEKIGDEGQRQWRALMQTHPCWAVLATTPSLFSGISRQISPFYGFFEVIHLQPLSFSDAIVLLQKLARLNKDEQTASFLETAAGRARVRAVQHIAGGNHRIFALFYGFLRESGTDSFVVPLLRTIDALTPYYQSHMARLSRQQQKIVNFLCENRKPATVKAIAANCLTTHQTAASQLKQLLENRYVRVDRVGREAFYELTEPLLRICVEAKSHTEAPLNLLVDFIRYWFSREELERRLSDSADKDAGRTYFQAALKEYDMHDAHVHLAPEIAPLCAALSQVAEPPEILRKHAEELAELSKIAEDWPHYTRALAWLDRTSEAIPLLERKFRKDPINVRLIQSLARAQEGAGDGERSLQLLDRAIELEPNFSILFLDKGQILQRQGRYPEALEALDQADFLFGDNPAPKIEKARVLIKLERYTEAREQLSPLLTKGRTIPDVFVLYAATLANEGDDEQALKYLKKATTVFENNPLAWANMGMSLCRLGRYTEALAALDRSIELDPDLSGASHHRCEALIETKQYSKAAHTATPDDLAHNIFHQLLKIANSRPKQGKLQEELSQLKSANESEAWQRAFVGGLTEFTSSAAQVNESGDLEALPSWNAALHELFAGEQQFSLVLVLFDVLTRWKVSRDTKALLDLPLEQRLLLVGKDIEHLDFNEC